MWALGVSYLWCEALYDVGCIQFVAGILDTNRFLNPLCYLLNVGQVDIDDRCKGCKC